jgi:hypothetical protein
VKVLRISQVRGKKGFPLFLGQDWVPTKICFFKRHPRRKTILPKGACLLEFERADFEPAMLSAQPAVHQDKTEATLIFSARG